MKKVIINLLAVIGAVLFTALVIKTVSAGAVRYSREEAQLRQWSMQYRAIHP